MTHPPLQDSLSVDKSPPVLAPTSETMVRSAKYTPVYWRIVFSTNGSFCVQITNNLGGSKPSWINASGQSYETEIPSDYLESLRALGDVDVISRKVVERRTTPLEFRSYQEALDYVVSTLGLPASSEWHPKLKFSFLDWIFSWMNRSNKL